MHPSRHIGVLLDHDLERHLVCVGGGSRWRLVSGVCAPPNPAGAGVVCVVAAVLVVHIVDNLVLFSILH